MIGSTFGRYVVLEKLGAGGMGEVFLAEDTSLHRRVALKFLPLALAESPEFRERFLIEAQAAAGLSHPNICVIHEVGEVDGRPFIAMEYVEGETLERKMTSGFLGIETAVDIMLQVAAGLEEAHGKGIVHRDIKSSNIMITPHGRAKLMDFGVAKVRGGRALTRTQATIGTAGYMSPEQAAGSEVDHRTDIWSAGVVLYELLAGRLPFQGPQDAVVLYRILNEEPLPLEGLDPEVPLALRRIVARAIEKDPAVRYGSAAELQADLRSLQEGGRVAAAGVLDFRRLVRLLRRPAIGVPAGVAAVALVLLAVGFAGRRADVRWARQEAIPEIRRLIGENDAWRNLVPPYRLAERAETILGDDPELAELFSKISLKIDVRTEPSGARIYMKEYATPEADWSLLGVTPLEGVRVPVGIFRWRFEKEGYAPVEAAASTWDVGGPDMIAPVKLERTLDAQDALPDGMVRVPATETPLGVLGDFFIGRHEVTNREYRAFVDAGGYRTRELWQHPVVKDGRELTWEQAAAELVDRTGLPGPATWTGGDYPAGEDDHPVSGVSWHEAAAYAEYAGMSLPTTVHWNVARGAFTPMIRWPQLGGFAVLAPFANFGERGLVPVGSLPGITAYGAYDMAGNVREWCWNETPEGRVIRGGSWEDNTYEFGKQSQAPPLDRSPRNGLRLAWYPDRERIPEAAFGFRDVTRPRDLNAVPLVPDPVFQAYRERFAYDPADLRARVESRQETPGSWVHEKISFDAAYGDERVLAHLFLPVNARPPYQTVVYFPGDASCWLPSSEGLESYYEFTMFLSYLVRNGRAVLYPVYKGTFERGSPELLVLHNGSASHAYSDYVVQVVQDLRRSVDYLVSRPDIDPHRIAYYGMSWGAYMGAIIPAVEDRLKASILLAGGLDGVGRPEANDLTYVSRVRTPTLMLNGRFDTLCPPDQCSRPLADRLGTPAADKRTILYETDHIPPRAEYIKETLSWLDRYLGPVAR